MAQSFPIISPEQLRRELKEEESSLASVGRSLTTDEILEDFDTFRPAWEKGYFESDLGAGELVWEGASVMLGGVWDFFKEAGYIKGAKLRAGERGDAEWMQRLNDRETAFGLQVMAELGLGYEAIGEGGKRIIGRMQEEDYSEEDARSAWEYWKAMTRIERDRHQGAKLMAHTALFTDYFSLDEDFKERLRRGEVEVNESAALGAALFADPLNLVGFGTAKLSMQAGKGYLSGAHRALLNSQAKMVKKRAFLSGVSKELQTDLAKNLATKEIGKLNREIVKNEGKLGALAQDRYLGVDLFAKGLPANHPMRAYVDDMLKGIDAPGSSSLTARGIGGLLNIAGKGSEVVGSAAKFLLDMPVESAITLMMRAGVPEKSAHTLLEKLPFFFSRGAMGYGLAHLFNDEENRWMWSTISLIGPSILSRGGRNMAVYGRQLAVAETQMPYFARLASMNPERLSVKLKDELIDRTSWGATMRTLAARSFDAPVAGGTWGETLPSIGRRFMEAEQLGPIAAGVTQKMEWGGINRLLEKGARVTEAAGKGAMIPAGVGLIAGGGEREGFYSGLGMGLVFGYAGGFAGEWGRFKNPAIMRTKQYGDLQFWKKTYLSEGQTTSFDMLSRDSQLAVATFHNVYPDVEIQFVRRGRKAEPGSTETVEGETKIEINVDSDYPTNPLMSHEVSHYLEKTGLTHVVNDLLLGNVYTKQPGLYSAIKDGNPIEIGKEGDARNPRRYKTSKRFEEFRKKYTERTKITENLESLISTDERIAREIFAEHGAHYFLYSNQRWAKFHEGPIDKLVRGILHNTPFLKNTTFMKNSIASFGGAFREGKVYGTGLFGEFKEVPGLMEMIRKHDRMVAGLNPENMKERFKIPKEADEFSTEITASDIAKNPELAPMLAAGTFFRLDADGRPVVNHLMTPREITDYGKRFANALADAIDAMGEDLPLGHIRPQETADGKTVYLGKFIDEAIIDLMEKQGGWNRAQIENLRQISKMIEMGEGAEILSHYFKATKQRGRRYVTARGSWKVDMPYAIELTKDGNVIIKVMSVNKWEKNLNYLFNRRGKDMRNLWGVDEARARDQFEKDFWTYVDNHLNDRPGGTGIGVEKRDVINGMFGMSRKEQAELNPFLASLPKRGASMVVWQSRRLDRFGKLQRLDSRRPVDHESIARNLMPRMTDDETVPLPFIEDLGGEPPEAGFKRVWTEKMGKKELAEWEALETKESDVAGSQVGPFIPRFGKDEGKQFMPAENAGAPKGKEAEAARLWQEKGTDSPFFKKWFGKSKVVDEEGNPLILYRGTTGKGSGRPTMGRATVSYTSVPEVANLYAHKQGGMLGIPKPSGVVTKVYMSLKNPLDFRTADVRTTLDNMIFDAVTIGPKGQRVQVIPDNFYPDPADAAGGVRKTDFTVKDLERLLFDIGYVLKDFNAEFEVSHWSSNWRLKEVSDITDLIGFLRDENKKGEIDGDGFVEEIWGILGGITLDQYILADSPSFTKWAKRAGYDGFIHSDTVHDAATRKYFERETVAGKPVEQIKGIDTEGGDYVIDTYRPFENEQVKSVWSNRGTFDPASPDISYMPAMNLADDFVADVVVPLKQEKASRAQVLASVDRSLGRSFAKDIGLIDFLEGKKSVSKGELETFVRENTPEIEVEVKGAGFPLRTSDEWQALVKEAERRQDFDEAERLTLQWEAAEGLGGEGDVKHAKYQEPGGVNYREIVFRFKPKEGEPRFPGDEHMGDNVLMWMRVNERVDPDGKRVYFIEEFQSDLHQKAKELGYRPSIEEYLKVKEELKLINRAHTDLQMKLKRTKGKKKRKRIEKQIEENQDLWEVLRKRQRGYKRETTPPDLIFKETWPAVLMKYAIKDALERGFDRIAWLDGEGQNKRYDINKQGMLRFYDEQVVSLTDKLSKRIGGGKVKRQSVRHIGLQAKISELNSKLSSIPDPDYVEIKTAAQLEALRKEGRKFKIEYEQPFHPNRRQPGDKPEWYAVTEIVSPEDVALRKSLQTEINELKGKRPKFDAHSFDLPRDPSAVDNLRLYMPSEGKPADNRPPDILLRRGAGRGAGYLSPPHSRAPSRDDGFPLHDVPGMYTDPIGDQFARSTNAEMDANVISFIRGMRENPKGLVTIFRAVPKHAKKINPNDWVTLTRAYAKEHGDAGDVRGDGFKILSKRVKASDLFIVDHLHEWGWAPEGDVTDTAMPEILLRRGAGRGAGRGMLPKVAGRDERQFMPRPSKGFDKRLVLRAREDLADAVDELARVEGISANDAYNVLLQDVVPGTPLAGLAGRETLPIKSAEGRRIALRTHKALVDAVGALAEGTAISRNDAMNLLLQESLRQRGEEGRQFMPSLDTSLGLKDNISDVVLPRITQSKLSPQQLQAALAKTAGAKSYADEIGLTDFVKGRKSVTKEEIETFVRENSPKLEVEVLGGREEGRTLTFKEAEDSVSDNRRVEIWKDGERLTDAHSLWGLDQWKDDPDITFKESVTTEGPKFSEYQEPGGTNYREIKVKLTRKTLNQTLDPSTTREDVVTALAKAMEANEESVARHNFALVDELMQSDDVYATLKKHIPQAEYDTAFENLMGMKGFDFTDPHYGDDVLLHLRVNDRIDANGKRVYFIEELQSSRHQQGRKEGYNKPVDQSELQSLRLEAESILIKRQALEAEGRIGESNALANEYDAINARIRHIKGERVPDAPFKKNWPALGLKYAIKEALEGGYDRVAWLDGEGQAARYDLSKHFNEIYIKGDFLPNRKTGSLDGEVTIDVLHTERHIPEQIRPEERSGYGEYRELAKTTVEKLPDFIGKELADKVIKDAQKNLPDNQTYNFKKEYFGLDLKVGGEGMKAFYDREVVSVANKISKKIGGGKVERREVETHLVREYDPILEKSFGSHVFDLPKDPAAANDLTLYMPGDRFPSDARPPEILLEIGKERMGARPLVAGRDERGVDVQAREQQFMPAGRGTPSGRPSPQTQRRGGSTYFPRQAQQERRVDVGGEKSFMPYYVKKSVKDMTYHEIASEMKLLIEDHKGKLSAKEKKEIIRARRVKIIKSEVTESMWANAPYNPNYPKEGKWFPSAKDAGISLKKWKEKETKRLMKDEGRFTDDAILDEHLVLVHPDGETIVSRANPRFKELKNRFEKLLAEPSN